MSISDHSERRIEAKAQALYEHYKDKIDGCVPLFEKRHTRPFSKFDAYALGKMLEQFETWRSYMDESIVMDNLGRVIPVALDLISAAYATSIMSVIASTQPIEEKVGVVFFKKMVAATARQGVSVGDVLFDRFGARDWAARADYASNRISQFAFCTLPDSGGGVPPLTDPSYSQTLIPVPILRGTVTVRVLDVSEPGTPAVRTAIDDGEGNIVGPAGGPIGTINYRTGAMTIQFTDVSGLTGGAPGTGDRVVVSFQTDIEQTANLPKLSWVTSHDTIEAQVFMLEGHWGLVTEFALQRRFGRAMDEEVATDLVSEINAEVATAAIREIVAACPNEVTWDDSPPAGTSVFDHKLSLIDAIESASTKISDTAGRGTVNFMLASGTGLTHLSTQPGFRKVATGNATGPHVYGILNDSITVIKVPGNNLVPADRIYCGYRGMNWFEAPVVYAPWLPLFVTDSSTVESPLRRARGVAHAAGIKVVAKEFLTCIRIT